jgi:hypothetical protein
MSDPVNHREQIEGWLAEVLAARGSRCGYAVLPSVIPVDEGAGPVPRPGWLLFITARHPVLGQNDLVGTITAATFTLTQMFVQRAVTDALKQLDEQTARIRREITAGAQATIAPRKA